MILKELKYKTQVLGKLYLVKKLTIFLSILNETGNKLKDSSNINQVNQKNKKINESQSEVKNKSSILNNSGLNSSAKNITEKNMNDSIINTNNNNNNNFNNNLNTNKSNVQTKNNLNTSVTTKPKTSGGLKFGDTARFGDNNLGKSQELKPENIPPNNKRSSGSIIKDLISGGIIE